MYKMLTTQISGLLQRIAANEQENIEETARLLAQAAVGEGTIYFACFDKLKVVETNALNSSEPFHQLKPWSPEVTLTSADRVCIFTRSSSNPEAMKLADFLQQAQIPFSAVASEKPGETNELADVAYTYISLHIVKGLLPNDEGERVVLPHALAALFVYEAIKLSFDEMLQID